MKKIKKKALITGITGQDGAYLAHFLIEKGYEVHGMRRQISSSNIDRINQLIKDPQIADKNFFLHYGDLTDSSSIIRIISQIQPNEIYNLAAQSNVHISFDTPEYTANVDALGTLRILEAIRILGLETKTKFYQASTSELFGDVQEPFQTEKTSFRPRSPYAAAKIYAFWISVNYREAYGIFACNGILFNHESALRGPTFVTKKITSGIARVALGMQECIFIGNLNAERDWGHARDYVKMQWLMMQQDLPEDFVIATGVKRSVRDFIDHAANFIGLEISWLGEDESEVGIVKSVNNGIFKEKVGNFSSNFLINKKIVKVDSSYYRPTEVNMLLGDASKARKKLNWEPEITFDDLVSEMMSEDIYLAKQHDTFKTAGERIFKI
jgi:GDPmannose 4,6-dehydratase